MNKEEILERSRKENKNKDIYVDEINIKGGNQLMDFQIKKAKREKIYAKIALMAPSGGGKTYSALRLATGMAQEIEKETGKKAKILMGNTEQKRGYYYANEFEYDIVDIEAPHEPEKYVDFINFAVQNGYDILIIDSLSHAWSGQGGVLEMVDRKAATSRSNNSYTAWRDVTPEHNRLVDTILQCKMHVIVCMRSKTAYELQENERGKKVPVKVGLAPVQRDGMEYEFTIVFDIEREKHYAVASKDRTGLFDGKIEPITTETGELIRKWIDGGVDVPQPAPAEAQQPAPAPAANKYEYVLIGEDYCKVLTKTGHVNVTELSTEQLVLLVDKPAYKKAKPFIQAVLAHRAMENKGQASTPAPAEKQPQAAKPAPAAVEEPPLPEPPSEEEQAVLDAFFGDGK